MNTRSVNRREQEEVGGEQSRAGGDAGSRAFSRAVVHVSSQGKTVGSGRLP